VLYLKLVVQANRDYTTVHVAPGPWRAGARRWANCSLTRRNAETRRNLRQDATIATLTGVSISRRILENATEHSIIAPSISCPCCSPRLRVPPR